VHDADIEPQPKSIS